MKRKPSMAVARLSKVVRTLQSKSDGEKKRLTTFFQNDIGQLNGLAGDGKVIVDVTPVPAQGVQTNQHIGASIRLHSTHYQFMLGQNANTSQAISYKLTWLAVTGKPYIPGDLETDFVNNVYQPNPFISGSVRDYNSQFNPDFFGTYKILRTIRGTIKPDQLANVTVTKTFNAGFKYNKGKGHDVRFNQNNIGPSNIFNGQIILVIQCDRGNHGSVAATNTGVYNIEPFSGLFLQYNKVDYYYDN